MATYPGSRYRDKFRSGRGSPGGQPRGPGGGGSGAPPGKSAPIHSPQDMPGRYGSPAQSGPVRSGEDIASDITSTVLGVAIDRMLPMAGRWLPWLYAAGLLWEAYEVWKRLQPLSVGVKSGTWHDCGIGSTMWYEGSLFEGCHAGDRLTLKTDGFPQPGEMPADSIYFIGMRYDDKVGFPIYWDVRTTEWVFNEPGVAPPRPILWVPPPYYRGVGDMVEDISKLPVRDPVPEEDPDPYVDEFEPQEPYPPLPFELLPYRPDTTARITGPRVETPLPPDGKNRVPRGQQGYPQAEELTTPHVFKRPDRDTKELKLKTTVASGSLLGIIFNGVTEAQDFIDAIYSALPKEKQLKFAGWYRDPLGHWHRRSHSLQDKALAIYNGAGDIDLKQAFKNLVKNQVGDAIGGGLGKINAKAQSKLPGTGPGAGTVSRHASRGLEGPTPWGEFLDKLFDTWEQ